MEILISKESPVPIYEQIMNVICDGVISGRLLPNDQLQSVRSMAKLNGINPNTVQKAYSKLEKLGVVYSIAGRGNFLADCVSIVKEYKKDEIMKRFLRLTKEAKNAGIWIDEILTIVDSAYY